MFQVTTGGIAVSDETLDVAIIVGSNREGRFGHVVGAWFARQAAKRSDMEIDLIDLAHVPLPAALPRQRDAAVQAFVDRIDRADAFVVVTPEYNHGYPAVLKQAIDIPHSEWQQKPVGFVSYGGVAGGLRAVEQLRQVFAELHVVSMRDTVSFHMAHERFDERGEPHFPEGCNAAAATMLDQLSWWGHALRNARLATAARR
jgi:NAD(P)H-dependent FMN reductase